MGLMSGAGSAATEGAEVAAEDAAQEGGLAASLARCGGLSFSADTQVKTPGGETAIADLKIGDTVEAYDPKNGETGHHQVTAVMVNADPVIEHLEFDTGSIETTPNHPFFTAGRGWVLAGSLVIGEQVRTDTGHAATVTGFTLEATPSSMWDITVTDAHSFFVGSGAVLVHNCPAAWQGNPKVAVQMAHPPGVPAMRAYGTLENDSRTAIDELADQTGNLGNIADMGSVRPLPGGGGPLGKLSQLLRVFHGFFGG